MRANACWFLALIACREERAPTASFQVADSSGIRLATSSAPSWTPATAWRLAATPRVVIGAAESTEEYEISWIWDAVLLGDGTLVVGNSGDHAIQLYDRAGRFVRRAGRAGAGPGEFGAMADLRMWRLPEGELAVRDAPLPRINVFDTTGTFRRTVTLARPDSAGMPYASGGLADATYLVMASPGTDRAPPGKIERSYAHYLRYDRDGKEIGWILRVDMAPHMTHGLGGAFHFPYLPFTVDPVVATDSTSVLLLRDGEPVIERYDLGGRLVERIAWSPPRHRVTPDLYRRLAASEVAAAPDPQQKRLWQDYYDQNLPRPEFAPAYQGLYVDETRHLWVERYRLPGDAVRVWDVIAPDGRWLGPLTMPGRFWLHRAGEAFLLGTQMDSMDREVVQVYDLQRK